MDSREEDHHTHQHDHSHGAHDHHHDHKAEGWWGRVREAVPFLHGHSHDQSEVYTSLEGSDRGIWALKVSLVALLATAVFQLIISIASGSVSLLADTIHNFTDALTAVPLWIAFVLGRRAPTRRYTYGYGRAEDVAGVMIVAVVFVSAIIAAFESIRKLIHPEPLNAVGWVIAAALIGFFGNELVAQFRIRVGNEIGSAALMADGQHARVDGLTSLSVLIGAVGSLLGFPLADPIVGLLITIAILFVLKDVGLTMWRRLMDAVEPETVDGMESTAAAVQGAGPVHDVRVRWLGHRLQAELHITVDEDLSTRESHRIVEEVRHALLHSYPQLESINVHVDPCGHGGEDPHAITAHHDRPGTDRGEREDL